jgi:hypothetical protein
MPNKRWGKEGCLSTMPFLLMQKVLINYEDADNTSEIANNIDVTEIDVTEMAGSSNEQHTETGMQRR